MIYTDYEVRGTHPPTNSGVEAALLNPIVCAYLFEKICHINCKLNKYKSYLY